MLQQVRGWIEAAGKQLERYLRKKDPVARNTAQSFLRDIRAAASPQAEYSVVKHLLAGMPSSAAARSVLASL